MSEAIEWARSASDLADADLEGTTEGYTERQMEYWLDRARRAVLSAVKAPVLARRVSDGDIDGNAPRDVQVDLVLGKLGNPGGIRTVQETNGPSGGSVTYGGETPGQLELTSRHLRMLGVSSANRRAAQTVQTWG